MQRGLKHISLAVIDWGTLSHPSGKKKYIQKPPDRKKEKRVQYFLKISTDIIKDNNVTASWCNPSAFSCSTAHDNIFSPRDIFGDAKVHLQAGNSL